MYKCMDILRCIYIDIYIYICTYASMYIHVDIHINQCKRTHHSVSTHIQFSMLFYLRAAFDDFEHPFEQQP